MEVDDASNNIRDRLLADKLTWLITGVAGFIGSNLLQALLERDQVVLGLDNFSTGSQKNIDLVEGKVEACQWQRFQLIKGDVRDLAVCKQSCEGVDVVLHHAALGSIPRSVADPIATHQSNVDGFLNMLVAARDAPVGRFVFASSSSVYGDHPALPRKEDVIGNPLSPYALTKLINEHYADVFSKTYGLSYIGFRYFNIFGERQNSEGAYAAVIPRWRDELLNQRPVTINGDGTSSRDFCYVGNAIQANLLAATTKDSRALGQIYNIAYGERTSLSDLFELMVSELGAEKVKGESCKPNHAQFRKGDVPHSLADISKAKELLGYSPKVSVKDGLRILLAD